MNRRELQAILEAEDFLRSAYELEGGTPDDTYCLEGRGYEWAVYYSERGQRNDEEIFFSEDEACNYFLELMRRTPSTKRRRREELPRP